METDREGKHSPLHPHSQAWAASVAGPRIVPGQEFCKQLVTHHVCIEHKIMIEGKDYDMQFNLIFAQYTHNKTKTKQNKDKQTKDCQQKVKTLTFQIIKST